ncbi:pyridoxamine 5'-phosphate oxidase family protein [Streptomyces sp. NPDC088194]|uniref:pyridoxamine 5'-phosphate oxidase family protein n=1 Tax=Streptomyces sp. NPDC088194 TaxID=3154931 RepID=UPI00344B2234
MDTKNLANLYKLAALDWSSVTDRLDAGFDQAPGSGSGPNRHTTWLTTIDPDGSPHVTAVGSLWIDDCFWFETGPATRKGRNLARDPRCTIAIATLEFDLVVEGIAEIVTDRATVARLATTWAEGGWPCEVDDSGTALTAAFSAPSAGRPPWSVYRITARSAYATATVEPGGATRWTF